MALPKAQTSSARIFATAALAGLGVGGLWVWLTLGQPGDEPFCRAAQQKAQTLKPKGELAAFIPAQRASRLPLLKFTAGYGETDSSQQMGKLTLYNIWATWCIPCREEMPALDALQNYHGGHDLVIIPISIDAGDDDKPKKFYADTKIKSLPLYRDGTGEAFAALRANGFGAGVPLSVLVDKDNCVLGHLSGPADWGSKDALGLIEAALKD